MMVHIKKVKKNIRDKALTIPTAIIQLMNADFDGDQLNVYRIFGLQLGKEFARNMDPTKNHYIDRMDGRVNRAMLPMKDEIAAFWALNNI